MSIFERFMRPKHALAPSTDATLTPSQTTQKQPRPFFEIIQFAVIALIIVIPIRWFIAQPFIVSGSSMENTFHTGDY